jgi:hypothetical protein
MRVVKKLPYHSSQSQVPARIQGTISTSQSRLAETNGSVVPRRDVPEERAVDQE